MSFRTDDDEPKHRAAREDALTALAVAAFDDCPDDRLRRVTQSLVRHLHAFIRDVRLTRAEWETAIGFLTRTGQISDEHRREFILLSDVLGASMLTVGVNSPAIPDATESTVFGPFFVEDAPEYRNGDDISRGLTGRPCHVHGRVTSTDGTPVAGARVEVWAADDDGHYDVQYEGAGLAGRGRLLTEADGTYGFWTVQPAAYPIPQDGPVGELLTATRHSHMRPAHVHLMVAHEAFETLITQVFVAGDAWLDDDAVYGVKPGLIADFVTHGPGTGPGGRRLEEEWSEAEFDIRLAPRSLGD
ncbi:dioxygenase [Streptomyces sp. NPDC057257]|uniref:dioxygenase family protein n=1 Tax=Streptomyces sp. NPDC057257 TaxID=3346071 RepID=UPI003624E2D3